MFIFTTVVTTNAHSIMSGAAHVKHLIAKKDKLEEEIKTWYSVLEHQGNVGTKQPLVDPQGFPRDDIDVVQVRTARNKIACLQNDHKELMRQIEAGLLQVHQAHAGATQPQAAAAAPQGPALTMYCPADQLCAPFAAIDLVSRGSPAETCGLRCGDAIVEFGSVTHDNFTGLASISSVVQHSRNKPVRVVVSRDHSNDNGERVVLSLTPREWDGRGLLGCNVVPI